MNPAFLLLASILLPPLGAAFVWAISEASEAAAKTIALATAVITCAIAGALVWGFLGQSEALGVYAASTNNWLEIGDLTIQFHLGLDGLGVWMYFLSALLTVTALLVSWTAIEKQAAGFFALVLLLEAGMLGAFAARDLIVFYIFFEFTLVPLFFLIGIWGSEERRLAAVKFFLYTFAGSILTFLGLLALVLHRYYYGDGVMSFEIAALAKALAANPPSLAFQCWVFLALFAGFAIKVPLFPLHTWLPLAHVQAPTAGSVLLAGVLLKLGVYGFFRFSLPMLPDACVFFMPWLLLLAAIGIIYGALVALAQDDIKRLIAYSSVSHMGFCVLGLFALNPLGWQGSYIQMIAHGLSTGGLFALVGMIYERYHTRKIADLGGLAARLPLLASLFVAFTLASVGLPGMGGFAGEFQLLQGAFQRGFAGHHANMTSMIQVAAVASVFGVVLGAWYMLLLVQKVFFGPLKEPLAHHEHAGHTSSHARSGHPPVGQDAHLHSSSHGHSAHDEHHGHGSPALPPGGPSDLNFREFLALAPLLLLSLWLGVKPNSFTRPLQPYWGELTVATRASESRAHMADSANGAHAPATTGEVDALSVEHEENVITALPRQAAVK